MDFDRFRLVTSNRIDPRWSLETIRELYDACGGSEVSTEAEVERIAGAYRLGLARGCVNGLSIGRGFIQGVDESYNRGQRPALVGRPA
jgi:hypothetical protein